MLDLGHNALEGGAACCAAALLAAETATGAASGSASVAGSSFAWYSHSGSYGADSASAAGQQAVSKQLVLDGNPLGASGVRILIRAIAGQPALCLDSSNAQLLHSSTVSGSGCGSSSGSGGTSNAKAGGSEAARDGFFLPAEQDSSSSSQQRMQGQAAGQLAMRVSVSIAKVSLLSKERGFRASLRATETVQALAAQVRICVCMYPVMQVALSLRHQHAAFAESG